MVKKAVKKATGMHLMPDGHMMKDSEMKKMMNGPMPPKGMPPKGMPSKGMSPKKMLKRKK